MIPDARPQSAFAFEPLDYSRGKKNEFSKKAFTRVKVESMKGLILRMVCESSIQGITLKECASKLDRLPHTISGRFSELQHDGKIHQSGERDGHGVWRELAMQEARV